ncbi:hypothetical protein Trydic_g46 [Trypoxylus dichotomus]
MLSIRRQADPGERTDYHGTCALLRAAGALTGTPVGARGRRSRELTDLQRLSFGRAARCGRTYVGIVFRVSRTSLGKLVQRGNDRTPYGAAARKNEEEERADAESCDADQEDRDEREEEDGTASGEHIYVRIHAYSINRRSRRAREIARTCVKGRTNQMGISANYREGDETLHVRVVCERRAAALIDDRSLQN